MHEGYVGGSHASAMSVAIFKLHGSGVQCAGRAAPPASEQHRPGQRGHVRAKESQQQRAGLALRPASGEAIITPLYILYR
jgi:hypothetical protein